MMRGRIHAIEYTGGPDVRTQKKLSLASRGDAGGWYIGMSN